jgi:multimeric flavodoxin WrbA
MKVFAINSSPATDRGNTSMILGPFIEGMREAGAEVMLHYSKKLDIKSCTGCFSCWKKSGVCCLKDDMQNIYGELNASDIWVFATPLYECGMTGTLKNFIDRTVACHYPGNTSEKPEKMVLVSSCGDWSGERFNSLVNYMCDLCANVRKPRGSEFAGALLRPHAGAMKPMVQMGIPLDDIFAAAKEAGRQIVKEGKIDGAVLNAVRRELLPREDFEKFENGSGPA